MAVLTDFSDNILTITINRPDAGNALNAEVGEGLVAAFKRAEDDDDVRAVILTGAGEKIFCAGMGLALLSGWPKPVIAAVNGTAVAGGFEVMMRADIVVAADHARFGIPEVKRGLVAAGGGTRLPTRIPLQVALELGLTGETIDARRAYDLGIVNRVVPAADVMSTALAIAALINANGPLAVQATKRLMLEEVGPDNSRHVGEQVAHVFASEDAKEGARAFAEKRAPIWKGR